MDDDQLEGYYGTAGNRDYRIVEYSLRGTAPPDPEMAELLRQDADLEAQAQQAVAQHRSAGSQQERSQARAALETLTKKHFEVRQKRRELEISRLEVQLQQIRAALKKRDDNKELIIQRRVAKLLGEEDELAF